MFLGALWHKHDHSPSAFLPPLVFFLSCLFSSLPPQDQGREEKKKNEFVVQQQQRTMYVNEIAH
jgi:hypothetical protein